MRTLHLWIVMILLLGAFGCAQAENIEFWIGDPVIGTPVTQVNVPLNGQFALGVWMTNDYPTKVMELLLGYDSTSSAGTTAVRLDNKIALVSVTYGTVANVMNCKYSFDWYGGDHRTSASEVRPGGYRLALAHPVAPPTALGPYGTATKVFDITLKNVDVAVGQQYYIGLWNARSGATSGGSFCTRARTTNRFQDLNSSDSCNPAYGVGSGWAVKVINNGSTPISVNDAKSAANGLDVSLADVTVTASFRDSFGPRCFAVEELDRSVGIRVLSTVAVNSGDRVTVQGCTAIACGELLLDATLGSVSIASSGNPVPSPVGMANKASGGGVFGVQGAVVNAVPDVMCSGANSVGLLMKIWGRVTAVNSTGGYDGWFYVDDGSGITDGSGNIGINCRVSGAGATLGPLPAWGSHVAVIGVMGVQQIGSINARQLWTISWSN